VGRRGVHRGGAAGDASAERLPVGAVPAGDTADGSGAGGGERPAGHELAVVDTEGVDSIAGPAEAGAEGAPLLTVPRGDIAGGDAVGPARTTEEAADDEHGGRGTGGVGIPGG
jgi:hypothetical protein